MNDDDRLICNRFLDAANACYNRDYPVATDFLDLHSQTLFQTIVHKLPPICHLALGGYDLAERKIILFTPYEGFPFDTPYSILQITPLNSKFSEDLSHRDFLGSILGLGITRDKIGDILVTSNDAIVFCTNSIKDFIIQNLAKIRNTLIKIEVLNNIDFTYLPEFKEIKGSVASLRLDSVISLGFNSSRSHLITYIDEGKVAVNGQIITSNAYNLKPDDIISVRGLGKIKFIKSISETKKGRLMVIIHKYI